MHKELDEKITLTFFNIFRWVPVSFVEVPLFCKENIL